METLNKSKRKNNTFKTPATRNKTFKLHAKSRRDIYNTEQQQTPTTAENNETQVTKQNEILVQLISESYASKFINRVKIRDTINKSEF